MFDSFRNKFLKATKNVAHRLMKLDPNISIQKVSQYKDVIFEKIITSTGVEIEVGSVNEDAVEGMKKVTIVDTPFSFSSEPSNESVEFACDEGIPPPVK